MSLRSNDYSLQSQRPILFMIEKEIEQGLVQILKYDIVLRLYNDVPDQPNQKQLTENLFLCQFILVLDREVESGIFCKNVEQASNRLHDLQ